MARVSPGRWALTLTESSDPADIKFKIRRDKVGDPGGFFLSVMGLTGSGN